MYVLNVKFDENNTHDHHTQPDVYGRDNVALKNGLNEYSFHNDISIHHT